MIKVENFSKTYFSPKKKDWAVFDVSFDCEDKKITGIIGVNGSGKSTLIKAIAAIHYPTRGKIFIVEEGGEKIDVAENPAKAKSIIGYVPEISILPPDMKTIDFLNYVAKLYEIQDFSSVVKKCAIEDVLSKKIKTLSKGYKQRLSFAQAILHNPSVLILDEMTSGLDPEQIKQMRTLVKSESQNRTVLLSTHNLQEASALCDKIIIMKKGKIVAQGTVNELIKKSETSNFEEAFLKLTKDDDKKSLS